MISKIELYNAPYEFNSLDRFYKDIDTKLTKNYVGEIKKFSFEIESTTKMEVTFNDKDSRGSYMAIESTLFKNKTISYWFLTAINSIESDEGTKYDATLDSIATFGEEVFDRLDGNKIKIDRMHEDRYRWIPTQNVFVANSNHSWINSDFKLGDTKGVELVFDGNNEDNSNNNIKGVRLTTSRYIESGNTTDGSLSFSDNFDTIIDNRIIQDNKVYYVYALVQFQGDPEMYNQTTYTDKSGDNYYQNLIDARGDKSAIRNTMLFPISTVTNTLSQEYNSLSFFSRLQEKKVVNIIKTPYKLTATTEAKQVIFDDNGKRIRMAERNGSPDPTDEVIITEVTDSNGNITISEGPHNYTLRGPRGLGGLIDGTKWATEIWGYFDLDSYHDERTLYINSKIGSLEKIMNFIQAGGTPDNFREIIDNDNTEILENGLLNPDIMPIEFKIENNNIIIDIYNLFNAASAISNDDKIYFTGSYTINEMGLETTLSLSDNQFIQWSENQIMSFSTDQGSTYLARNKYTMDAQKAGIDIQKELVVVQARSREAQAGANAANPVSMVMSLGASLAGSASAAAYAGQEAGLQRKLADNKKMEIQASINDASAIAPSLHTGTTHNLANLNPQEYKWNFNWVMKKPNKIIRNKIVEFYDRHGYTFHDWIVFSKSMVENRSRFNFIEMDEFKDFIGTFGDFDINVLNLLDAEFKKGLRLWHIDEINYNSPNLENVIVDNI